MSRYRLVIIDPQNSFCYPGILAFAKFMGLKDDQAFALEAMMKTVNPEEVSEGELFVPGGFEDMIRVSQLIETHGDNLIDIHVTLDSHHWLDIAHPIFWVGKDNIPPNIFTMITHADVKTGVWRARVPRWQEYALYYVQKLEENKRYPLVVWNPHCLISRFGHNVVKPLTNSLLLWERKYVGSVDYVTKGSNFKTEHYSAVQADVIDPEDAGTGINWDFIHNIEDCDYLLVAGEAKSHCVANTLRDLKNNFGPDSMKKVILLSDCMSDVPGFEALGTQFFDEMRTAGVSIKKSTEIF